MKYIIVFLLPLMLILCSDRKKSNSKRGYIVYNEVEHFFFVPVKEFNSDNCLSALRTENLAKGIQFNIHSYKFLEIIQKSSIEVKDELIDGSYAKDLQTLKIVPVDFEYKVAEVLDKTAEEFEFRILGRDVKLNWDHESLDILNLEPIKCKR